MSRRIRLAAFVAGSLLVCGSTAHATNYATAATVYSNLNGLTVLESAAGPSAPTVFTLSGATFIGTVWDYHFPFSGNVPYAGYVPAVVGGADTITLTGAIAGDTFVLPAVFTTDLYGAPYIYAAATINAVLPADTYTVTDAAVGTWSFNDASGLAGFTRIDAPEPMTLSIVAAGIAGLGLARRRRR